MKAKLTLTIDKDLLPIAKRCARARRHSLSSLVEEALRQMTRQEEPSFADKWTGKFRPANRKTTLYKALAKKYL